MLLKPFTNTLPVHTSYLTAELWPMFLWDIHFWFGLVRLYFFLFVGRCLRHQCDSFQVKHLAVFSHFPYECPDFPVYLKAWGTFQRNSQQGNTAFFIWVIHIESERLLSQAQLAVCCCLKSLAVWDYTKHLLKVQKILCATLENVIKVRFVVCILHKNINNFFFWVL